MRRSDWDELRRDLGRHRSAHPTLLVLLADAAITALAFWLNLRGSLLAVLAAVALQTLALLHGYLIHHEAGHRSVFRTPGRNAALGHVLGWMLALPFLPRQRAHALHHAWTGHPEGDPANRRAIARFGSLAPRAARWLDRLWRAGVPFLAVNERLGLWLEPFRTRAEGAASRRVRSERRWALGYLAGYAMVAAALGHAGLLGVTLRVWAPALLLCAMLEELVNLPHHAETPLIDSAAPLPLWLQDRVTHGCRHVPLWSSLVILHFNLHVAHHFFPWLPWYQLPRAQRAMARRVPALGALGASEARWARTRRTRGFVDVLGHYFVREARRRDALAAGTALARDPRAGAGVSSRPARRPPVRRAANGVPGSSPAPRAAAWAASR